MPCRAALPQPQCRRARAARAISARMRFDGAPVPLAGARPGGSRAAKVRLAHAFLMGRFGMDVGEELGFVLNVARRWLSNGSFHRITLAEALRCLHAWRVARGEARGVPHIM